jgi:hypothetical protein
VNAGATVIGPRPRRATGLQGDAEVLKLAAELWGGGRVIEGRTARQVLADKGVRPDFEGAGLDYIHRRTPDADIYFVSNQSAQAVKLRAVFRVAGKAPELWDPATARIRKLAAWEAAGDGRTAAPLDLAPYGSAVIVFRKPGKPGRKPAERTMSARTIEGAWTVRFAQGPAATFDVLRSWTEHTDPEIKYFSGTAVYSRQIEIPSRFGRLELDLGDVREIAEVLLNGKNLGLVWKLPRTVDITAAARAGSNALEVRVTNLWPNRLIGDQLLPESERRTRTNIRKFTKDSPLLPSGLLGPVVLRH